MKKNVALLVALLFLFLLVLPASAHTTAQTQRRNKTYGYTYRETIADDGKIVRTYQSDQETHSEEYTKSVLKDLGMNENFISMLSEESLDEYANAESITCITTYTRTDADGNTQIVRQKEAENALSTYSDKIDQTPGGLEEGPAGKGWLNGYTDSYMEISLMIVYIGDGVYYFSVDATWLTEPLWRGWDSIGICASSITIDNETRSGWFKYDTVYKYSSIVDLSTTTTPQLVNFTSDEEHRGKTGYISTCNSDGWNGSGALIELPIDIYYEGETYSQSISHTNFRAHFEFYGEMQYPSLETNFNVIASYDHATVALGISPSLEIGVSGGSFAIGLSIYGITDRRVAETSEPIHYVP